MGLHQPIQSNNHLPFVPVQIPTTQRSGPASRVPVRAVVIVAGDVLFDQTAWYRWLFQLLTRMGLHTHFSPFCHVWETDYLSHVQRGQGEYWDALQRFLQSTGLSRGRIEEVIAASISHRRELEEQARPLPGVRLTLSRLAETPLNLVAVANTHHDQAKLHGWLERLGLAEYFETIVSSHSVAR